MAAARRCGETGPTPRKCRFLAAILPFDDVLRCGDVINEETRVCFSRSFGRIVGNQGVALAVLVDRYIEDVKFYDRLRLAARRFV